MITVTGSTGTIGTELVRRLSETGVPVRAVLRDFTRARPLEHVAWLQADLAQDDKLDATLAGTDRLFLLTGNQPGFGATQSAVIRAAARLGVQHVVKLSAFGATGHSRAPLAREHWDVEQVLQQTSSQQASSEQASSERASSERASSERASSEQASSEQASSERASSERASSQPPMSWTILRPHTFMQNWLGDVAQTVRAERTIYAAIGDGRVPFIDARDIADVAFEALLHPDVHAGQTYVLTGGVAVGYGELAEVLSDTIGAPVTYRALSMEEARARLERQGVAPASIDSMLALAAYQKKGGPTERTSDSVERILGRAPRDIAEFARDYRGDFGR